MKVYIVYLKSFVDHCVHATFLNFLIANGALGYTARFCVLCNEGFGVWVRNSFTTTLLVFVPPFSNFHTQSAGNCHLIREGVVAHALEEREEEGGCGVSSKSGDSPLRYFICKVFHREMCKPSLL